MNIISIFKACKNALLGQAWEDLIDVSAPALPKSFLAVAAYIPLGLIVAKAAVKFNDNTDQIPYGPIIITLVLVALTFPLLAYLLCMVFNKMDKFRPWVILRNWTILFAFALIAAVLGLYLLGLVPFFPAYVAALSLYLATLAIDIRLAWRIAEFDWIGAVFAGILISAGSIMVMSLVVSQYVS